MENEAVDLEVRGWTVHTVAETFGSVWLGIELRDSPGLASRGRLDLDPLRDAGAVGPNARIFSADELLDLVGKRLASASATPKGTLRVVFEDGLKITVDPRPDVEAWEFKRDDGSLLFCMPGGLVDSFAPRDSRKEGRRAQRKREA